jgi:4-hydroxythreonine-4-phosphate dehydrogenase
MIALTPGEPAGIGPDLVVQLAATGGLDGVAVIADPELLLQRAEQLDIDIDIAEFGGEDAAAAGVLQVLPVELAAAVTPGRLDKRNAHYVLETIERAVKGCLDETFGGLVTGPVHKGVINESGIPFTGHTEFLAALTGAEQEVMMLATPIPLSAPNVVPRALTQSSSTYISIPCVSKSKSVSAFF